MFNYSEAYQYIKNKDSRLQSKRLSLWEKAQKDSLAIIEMIIQNYHPQQIIQWGSVLDQKHFSEASDIDLAIVGIGSLDFMKLLADAEELTRFSLDLVRWEELYPSFQKIILMKGKIIYEHRKSIVVNC